MKIEKIVIQRVRNYYSYKLCFLHKLRETNLSYSSKYKKDIKRFELQFELKFVINMSCFNEEAWGYAFSFVEMLSKNKLRIKLAQRTRLLRILKRSRRLTTKHDVVTTSGRKRRIYDVLKTSNLRRLEDI